MKNIYTLLNEHQTQHPNLFCQYISNVLHDRSSIDDKECQLSSLVEKKTGISVHLKYRNNLQIQQCLSLVYLKSLNIIITHSLK